MFWKMLKPIFICAFIFYTTIYTLLCINGYEAEATFYAFYFLIFLLACVL